MKKRILVKVSGEQLSGEKGHGIDLEFLGWFAEEIKKVTEAGTQVVVVAGAGNWIRGADFAGNGLERATADYMGMLAGVINGQALMDIFQDRGIPTRVMSSFKMDQICEPYVRRKAIRHLEKGRVVIVSGGLGKPFFTHDTAAVTYGLELDCEEVLKATNVDGVYNKDPNKFDDAVLFEHLTLQKAIETPAIKVMDKAAIGLAMEQKMAIRVFDLHRPDAILKIAQGEQIGTLINGG
jgi:uridylate kinase